MTTVATELPVNFRKLDHSDAAITGAVAYALTVADGYLGQWAAFGPRKRTTTRRPLAGVRVLEIGPGPTLGVPVLLACAGAEVTVADRFPASWDPDFHPPFYEALYERVRGRNWNVEPIRRLLRARDFIDSVVASRAVAAEQVDRAGGRFDLVLSNAVLEHVEDLSATAASLARITAPGAYGFHQIDFRDHRDFSRPLEFLTISEDEFATIRRDCFCECGGWWRVSDVAAAFTAEGFRVDAHPNLLASSDYVTDVRARLRPEFAGRPDSDLVTLSALVVMSRPRK